MTRVLVCGGRDYNDRSRVFQVLDDIGDGITRVITGGAPGADHLAHVWACRRDKSPEQYMAEWDRLGRRAGPIRNQRMIDEGKPDLVIAFAGGSGTADMIRRARAAGTIRASGAAPSLSCREVEDEVRSQLFGEEWQSRMIVV